jgi:hypothetical protein
VDEESSSPETVQEAPEETREEGATPVAWLRLIYAFEFLIAIEVIFTLWSQVGGQGHLDLMPWYLKLACVAAMAWCTVRFTAGLAEQPHAWNRRTAGWFTGIVLVSVTMFGITYYYHLHEAPDESDSDDTQATSVTIEARPNYIGPI